MALKKGLFISYTHFFLCCHLLVHPSTANSFFVKRPGNHSFDCSFLQNLLQTPLGGVFQFSVPFVIRFADSADGSGHRLLIKLELWPVCLNSKTTTLIEIGIKAEAKSGGFGSSVGNFFRFANSQPWHQFLARKCESNANYRLANIFQLESF